VLDDRRDDYNAVRPQSALHDRTPAAVGAPWVDPREVRESTASNNDRAELKIAVLQSRFRCSSFAGRPPLHDVYLCIGSCRVLC